MSSIKSYGNRSVVWEAKSFLDDYQVSQTSGGWFDLSHWDCVRISGPDAWDFLNRMSTVNFKNFPVGRVAPGAFLTGKSNPIVWGYFLRPGEQEYLFLVPPEQGTLAWEHIEKFHFQENLTVEEEKQLSVLGIWSERALLERGLKVTQELGTDTLVSPSGGWMWRDTFRPKLVWWLAERATQPERQRKLEQAGLAPLGYRLFEFFRLDAGLVWVGKETDEKTLALQAGLDLSISPQKGCYPGQEVVERIRTYGRVNSLISRVEIAGALPSSLPVELVQTEGKAVGNLVAFEVLPDDPSRAYGIAYINRSYLDSPDKPALSFAGQMDPGPASTGQVRIRD